MNNLLENENTIDFTENNENNLNTMTAEDDMYLDVTVALPYPGTPLRVGSAGTDVSVMQSYLNAIRQYKYTGLSRLTVDGIYGQATKTTVAQYQGYAGLHIDGVIGEDTWNSIVMDYASLPTQPADTYPGTVLRPGSSGTAVRNMQTRLNRINPVYSAINYQTVDGLYGTNMTNAVRRFQGQFGLVTDGLIGPLTWDKIVSVHTGVMNSNNTDVVSEYPGYALNTGSRGDSVRFIQSYLNSVNTYNSHRWPILTVDGIYGSQTKQVVTAFQNRYNLTADGITGPNTWRRIISEFNKSI